MSDHIKVDTAMLRDLSGKLEKIHSTIDGATHTVDGYESDIGSPDVYGAVHGMASDWSRKRKSLLETLESLSKSADQAAEGYDGVDAHLAAALIKADQANSGDSG